MNSEGAFIPSSMRRFFVVFLSLLTVAPPEWAQTAEPAKLAPPAPVINPEPMFGTQAYIKRRFYTPSTIINLAPPKGLRDLVIEGKLRLSLRDFLRLTLSNNYDISVQQLIVQQSENAITRALAIFDPTAIASFSDARQKSPSTSQLSGASTLNQLTQPLNMSVTQTTPTGGSYTVGFSSTRTSSNSSFSTVNPAYSMSLNATVSQPLLRNRGSYITRLPITLAQSRLKSAQATLEDRVLQLIVAAEATYWNVIEARENLRVQQETLKLADAALQRSKRELELGAISALEIFQPEANFANAQIQVTQAGYRLSQTEDAVRRQIGADLDPETAKIPLLLTESVDAPEQAKLDKPLIVSAALKRRADLQSNNLGLAVDDLVVRQVSENLRPDLSLGLNYASAGIGGNVILSRTPVAIVPGGATDALGQVFGFSYPTLSASLTLRFPLRDRRTSADLADAVINKKMDVMRIRSLEQNIRLQVLNAVDQVENSKASVQLAKVALDLAQKRVDADQKRYELGTTTIFFVLASQNDLAVAAGALVREQVNYRRNLLALYQSTGQLLDVRGIAVR